MKLLIKTITLNIACICALIITAFAQQKYHFKNQATIYMDEQRIDTLHATPEQLAHIHMMQKAEVLLNDHYYYEYPFTRNIGIRFNGGVKNSSQVYEGLSWGLDFKFKSVIIDGNCPVEFSALFITEKNAASFLYRIVQNDNKEIVPWSTPSVFKYTADHEVKYAYLGKFNYEFGRRLKIEVYNKKQFSQQDAMLVDWRKIEPANVYGFIQYIEKQFTLPDNGLFSYGLTELKSRKTIHQHYIKGKIVAHDTVISRDFSETLDKNEPKFRLGDSIKNLSFDIQNGHRSYMYLISLKRTIDGITDSIKLGEKNSRFDLYKEFWRYPGTYQLTLTPILRKHGGTPIQIMRNLATNVRFTVLPALDTVHTVPFRTLMLIIIIILTTGGFMFMMYRDNQKRKLAREAQNKQIATLQLQSVRAQLNPHFIFNALAGIQNLMNKNEVENANKYLSRFARLTRNILDNGQKELTTIEHETDLLRDYLQMEQMRFGFKFSIEVDEHEIDQQIEIPAMLLQPFVENAVKHGVSALKDKGKINVAIRKKDSNLLLTVQDNGKGFSNTPHTGMGIKLCQDRIKLLNSIYKNTTILLHQSSSSNGTTITIELQNWI